MSKEETTGQGKETQYEIITFISICGWCGTKMGEKEKEQKVGLYENPVLTHGICKKCEIEFDYEE
jgi:hypothetical protein